MRISLHQYTLVLLLISLSSFSWQCVPSDLDPCDKAKPDCRTNLDCGDALVCWLCECVTCSKGSLPCGPGKACVPITEDSKNCGSCGNNCENGQPICVEGKCRKAPKQEKDTYIPPGSFQMGSPSNEQGRYVDETPHKVTITQPFFMWKTEVTQQEFSSLLQLKPSFFKKCGANCPVEQVTWHEALLFCNAMSKRQQLPQCFDCKEKIFEDKNTNSQTKKLICSLKETYTDKRGNPDPTECWGYRLPTESEWEYAARAKTKSATYNGELINLTCGPDRLLNQISWYCGNSEQSQVVGLKRANKWKLLDMLGNVREWTWDFYGPYPQNPSTGPTGPTNGSGRVVRGGCWSCRALESRSSYRFDHNPSRREYNLGFRIVRNTTKQ